MCQTVQFSMVSASVVPNIIVDVQYTVVEKFIFWGSDNSNQNSRVGKRCYKFSCQSFTSLMRRSIVPDVLVLSTLYWMMSRVHVTETSQ